MQAHRLHEISDKLWKVVSQNLPDIMYWCAVLNNIIYIY